MRTLIVAGFVLSGCADVQNSIGSAFDDTDNTMRFVYAALLLVLVGSSFSLRAQGGALKTLRNIAAIILAFAVLIVGYTYKSELGDGYQRVRAQLLPGTPQTTAGGDVVLTRSANGHFETLATVNGASSNFLVDTGASSIVLTFESAQDAGFSREDLTFSLPVSTANGTTFVAPVTLNAIKVGGIVVNDVRAAVSRPGDLSDNLLGMTFLNRLKGYAFRDDTLILSQ